MLAALTLSSACVTTIAGGDAGCDAYGRNRVHMPQDLSALPDDWVRYIVTTDTDLTAVCR